jgi:hypothetical protein
MRTKVSCAFHILGSAFEIAKNSEKRCGATFSLNKGPSVVSLSFDVDMTSSFKF